MKYCRYCGKELHEKANYCPYCMKSQIEKQSAVIPENHSKKWLCFLIIGAVLSLLIVIVCFLQHDRKELPDDNSNVAIESSESVSTTLTEPIVTTISATTPESTNNVENISTKTETVVIKTEITTNTTPQITENTVTKTTTIITTETNPQSTVFQIGDYITEGKTLSQIQGYGGHENPGGTVLSIEEIDDSFIVFSLIMYSESGLSSDTISARNITAEIVGNTAEFSFTDMLDGKGAGRITLENGKIHIETWGDISNSTSIIKDEYLSYNDF